MLTNSAAQTEAKRLCAGRKTLTGATVWATDFPVWATENPVTLTVEAKWPTLRPGDEAPFRVFFMEILVDLTKEAKAT